MQDSTLKSAGPHFSIEQIFVKDVSFESPIPAHLFKPKEKPSVDIQLNVSTDRLESDVYQVVLSLTVTTKTEDKTVFLVEVHHAGLFKVIGFEAAQMHRALGTYAPNILFPYARELISDLIVRGGFAPLYLAPINFDALYDQQLKQQGQKITQDNEAESTASAH